MSDRYTVSPKGHVTLQLEDGSDLRILMDTSAIADADEQLGRSVIMAMASDPMNLHILHTAILHGARYQNKGARINTRRDISKMTRGLDVLTLAQAVEAAMVASGAIRDPGDATEPEAAVPDDDDQGEP